MYVVTKYRHLAIEGFRGSPDPAEIRAVERELGTSLPQAYRAFLNAANGGRSHNSVRVATLAGSEELTFSCLFYAGKNRYGGYTDGDGTLLGELRGHRQSFGIPRCVLPFAGDGSGCYVYLDLSAAGAGKVRAYIHGLPKWAGGSERDELVDLAPDFDSFVDMLFLEEHVREECLQLLAKAQQEGNRYAIETNRAFLDAAVPRWRAEYPHLTR